MKVFAVIFLLLTSLSSAYSYEEDCETTSEIEEMAESFLIPNCSRKPTIFSASRGDFSRLCDDCAPKYDKAMKTFGIPRPASNINLEALLLNELKKSLSANLLDIVALRSAYPTGADFEPAISSCNIDEFEKRLENKKCTQTNGLGILKRQLSEELANFFSGKTPAENHGIFDRSTSKYACEITDKDILWTKSLSLEEEISEDHINKILSMANLDQESLNKELKLLSDNPPLADLFRSHPVFSQLMADPAEFNNFFKTIAKPFNKDSFRKALYTSKNNNLALVKGISEKCQKAFNTYEETVCNKNFRDGKVRITHLSKVNPLINLESTSNEKFIDPDIQNSFKTNENLLNICKLRNEDPKALNLLEKMDQISGWMPEEYSGRTFNDYRMFKYRSEIGTMRDSLCAIESKNGSCDPSEYSCRLYNIYKKSKDQSSQEGRLASSSNESVNQLLRSFIGSPKEIPADTRAVLVSQGILPKNDQGEFVAQPDVPERRPGYFGNQVASSPSNAPAPSSAPAPTLARTAGLNSASRSVQREADYTTGFAPGAPSTYASDYSDLIDSNKELSSINEEIIRRLSQRSASANQEKTPVNKVEARKVVKAVAKERGFSLTPDQETALAENYMANAAPAFPSIREEDKAALDPGESAAESWKKEQRLKALAGMQGAQQSGAARGIASVDTPNDATNSEKDQQKNLSTVALNISEDKIRLNLSDVLNDKIMKNDSEGQLLKVFLQNKKDFILQVNNQSFRVNFDKTSRSFKVLFDSGDPEKARQLTPQLERFFNRVNSHSLSEMRKSLLSN